jgi:hypothetical protein
MRKIECGGGINRQGTKKRLTTDGQDGHGYGGKAEEVEKLPGEVGTDFTGQGKKRDYGPRTTD